MDQTVATRMPLIGDPALPLKAVTTQVRLISQRLQSGS